MGKPWWCLVVAGAIAGACQADHQSAPVGAGAKAGASSSGTTAGSGEPIMLGIGGNDVIPPIEPNGAAGMPDLSGVVAPVVHCQAEANGGQSDGGQAAAGGAGQAKVAPPLGGAPFDDACSPPPSVCLDNLVLVYFDQGECVAGRCEWVKRSLTCRNLCRATGCQDSITTK